MKASKFIPKTSSWRYADLVKGAKKLGGPDNLINKVSREGKIKGSVITALIIGAIKISFDFWDKNS